ncbi:MAG TPA: hypothetical protein VGC42_28005 [Kofleriaceae bacterium]
MSERIQRIALGAALLAVVLVGVALIVTLRRGRTHGAPLIGRTMHVRELARLSAETVEPAEGGVHIQPTVAAALGLAPGDVLIAISGRATARPGDVTGALRDLAALHPTQWFVELAREGAHVVERWDLDGEYRPGLTDDDDARRASIHRIGATRYELPRAAVFEWLAQPARLLAGVASTRRVLDSIELQRVRPGSLIAALGLQDGDQLRAINGVELAPLDSAAALAPLVSHADQLTLDIRRHGVPLLLNYTIR